MQNIALLFGGKSCEHDISIITAMQTLGNVSEERYNIFPIYITKDNKWFLVKGLTAPSQFVNFNEKKFPQVFMLQGDNSLYKIIRQKHKALINIDCAIICCHGLNGEDGTLQGLLELAGVPYTSSSTSSSAICMDKVFMKQIFEVNNFPITKYVWFTKSQFVDNASKIFKEIKQKLNFPVIVKPANLGSSIGISKCENEKQLKNAIDVALHYDKKILVEEVVAHMREINCAVMGGNNQVIISNLDEPKVWSEFFDFNQKYLSKNIKFVKQNNLSLPRETKMQIKKMAKSAFQIFDCSGVVRIDFLFNNDTEEIFVSEINSIPGSLSNFMFDMPFSKLIDNLIFFAIQKHKEKSEYVFSYESPVLQKNLGFKK